MFVCIYVYIEVILGAGEMAQWVRAPDCSSEGQEFKSQQPHGGWFTTTHNEIWCPRLVCPTTATCFSMLGKICALGRKAAKQVRVVVLYSKDFGSGLPFYSQKAVWEPCTDRKGNHVKQNQKKKYMSVKQNKAHILCTKPATLVAE